MRVLLIGAPGSGKGTQGARIAERYRIPHISSGQLLRDHVRHGSELGRAVEPHLARGDLVPDDVILSMITEELAGAADGYVLDGFPRNVAQAEAAEKTAELDDRLDAVLFLDLPPGEVLDRLAERARQSDRPDDQEQATVQHRLRVYEDRTHPLLDHYRQRGLLVPIDANGSVDEVAARIAAVLDRYQG
ncbi:MAG TPA: adenylate kinase [Actinomycetes bacterium]|nr:adenylate kinase [Actinomycetes bacterium]